MSRSLKSAYCLLALLVIADSVMANCSTGAWTSTTGQTSALGEATLPKGLFYEGQCGLTIDAANPGYVTTQDPVDEDVVSAQFLLNPDSLSIGSGDVEILDARDGGTTQLGLSLRKVGDDLGLVTTYRSGGSPVESSPILIQPVWQVITLGWQAGDGNGVVELALDGVTQLALADLNNAGEVINEVDLGIVNSPSASGELAVDAFELRRTAERPEIPADALRELKSISTRAEVGTINNITIGGFIIAGDTEKCVVIRGRGPSMGGGLDEEVKVSDPSLTLKSGPTTLAVNDNWQTQDNPNHVDFLTQTSLAPSNANEAAIYTCLNPGGYTALLRGVGGTTGIGIVEIIDADTGLPLLGSLSTRARVGTRDNRTIGGFIISGDEGRRILLRARGKSVGGGIDEEDKIADPYLRLRSQNTGTFIAENDNWGDDPEEKTAIEATGAAPGDPNDSAILMDLEPGNYTAILSGVGGTTGIGIVEIIDLNPSRKGE
jgi:hypothetical protein